MINQLYTTILKTYQGEIKYGSKDNRILFQSTSFSEEFTIDKKGNIIPVHDYGDYHESGGFEGSKIFKYHYYHRSGGIAYKYEETNIYGERN